MEAFALPDARGRVDDAVDALVDESIDGFSTHALGADLIDIRRAIDRLEAEFVRRLHRFDRDHGAVADGGVGTVSWLRANAGMTGKTAAYRVHLARTLGELPATLDSARAGRASFTNVTMIAHLAEDVGVERIAPLEQILVSGAETLDPGRMRVLTQHTRMRLDPDGVLAADNHAHERRWLDCDQTYGGVFVVRGEFDAESGMLLKTAIDALSQTTGPGDTRTGSQHRADGVLELVTARLRSGDHPDVHGQRPHLTLTVSAETLRTGGHGAPAELSGVGPIHAHSARRIACDAVRTVVTVAPLTESAASTAWADLMASSTQALPLSVGRATRTIPAHIRTALHLRDQGCRFPDCDRPPAWTDGHHIIHWADGGPTDLDNLVSLCRRHHRPVHEQGWRIAIADGRAVVQPPPRRTCEMVRQLVGASQTL